MSESYARLLGDERAVMIFTDPQPVALVADAIRDCSNRNDVILDPFGGVGSTLIAAERTGRKARVIELDPRQVAGSYLGAVRQLGGGVMSDALPPGDGEVGYKRPPAHARFQKGRSGNPR